MLKLAFALVALSTASLQAATFIDAPISPDAVKALEQEELLQKLTGSTTADLDLLDRIVHRMAVSEERLKSRDPGELTQEHQRRILVNLDILISLATPVRPPQPSTSTRPASASQPSPSALTPSRSNNPSGSSPANSSARAPSSPSTPSGTPLTQVADSWAPLRPRDLADIPQHINEEFVPKYKLETARYFEALAQIGKAARNP